MREANETKHVKKVMCLRHNFHPMVRDPKRFFYEQIARNFDQLQNTYDLRRRLEIIEQELEREQFDHGMALDAGCGSGEFSACIQRRATRVISLDISESLVRLAVQKAHGLGVVGDALALPLRAQALDLVVSSEMLEHTPSPTEAMKELMRVLRPGGLLVLTTPNHRWEWLVRLASWAKVRGFHGYENFLGFRELAEACAASGLDKTRHFGFHPWPFQIGVLRGLSMYVDSGYGHTGWGAWMINQIIVGRKPHPHDYDQNH
jgi:ubiquinone/menaquinone biosynthesis C-methylase UbiE